MNPDWLLKHFDQISEAPDAIPRLRRFILDLAVRGKLGEQDPADEPASELLKQIMAEKEHIENAGKIRNTNLLLPVECKNALFNIPKTWKWVCIEDIAYIEMGQSPSSEFYNQYHEGLPFYQGKADFGKIHPTPRYWCTAPTKLAEKGDILISVRAPVGPTNVSTETCCIGRGLAALRPYQGYERDFLLICLKKSEPDLEALGAGTTFVAINRKHLVTFPVPLPPLAEQHRIVAKVDELMTLCDELEGAQAKRERRRDRLVAATLHGLNNGDYSSELGGHPTFEESARFYFNHIPRLTTRPEHIHQLRQTILNLAVRGKLVPQDPNDEPAIEIVMWIEREKKRLVEVGEIKKLEPIEPVGEADMPFTIPVSWQVVIMGCLAKKLGAGSTPLGGKTVYQSEGVPFLRSQNVHDDGLKLEDVALIPRAIHERMSGTHIQRYDILLNITGASIGRCSLVPDSFTEGNVSQHVSIIRLFDPAIREFIHLSLISPIYQKLIMDVQVGVSREGLSMQRLKLFPMVLPPLAEQHRIVANVNKLMALCDELETRITKISNTRRQLLEATLSKAIRS